MQADTMQESKQVEKLHWPQIVEYPHCPASRRAATTSDRNPWPSNASRCRHPPAPNDVGETFRKVITDADVFLTAVVTAAAVVCTVPSEDAAWRQRDVKRVKVIGRVGQRVAVGIGCCEVDIGRSVGQQDRIVSASACEIHSIGCQDTAYEGAHRRTLTLDETAGIGTQVRELTDACSAFEALERRSGMQ